MNAPDHVSFGTFERTSKETITRAEMMQTKPAGRSKVVALSEHIKSLLLGMLLFEEDEGNRPLPSWWKSRRNRLATLAHEFDAVVRHKEMYGDN